MFPSNRRNSRNDDRRCEREERSRDRDNHCKKRETKCGSKHKSRNKRDCR